MRIRTARNSSFTQILLTISQWLIVGVSEKRVISTETDASRISPSLDVLLVKRL